MCICLFVNTMIQGIFCSSKLLILKTKNKTFTCHRFWNLSSLNWLSVVMMQEGRGEWDGNSLLQFLCIHRQCQSHSMAAILWWVCVTTSQNKLKSFQWSSVFLWMIHIVRDFSKAQDRQHVCRVNMCLFIIIFENNTGLYEGFWEGHCSL